MCEQGAWGECTDGNVTTQSLVRGGTGPGVHVLAYSMPAVCMSNPCDPNCEIFDEVPPVPPKSVQSEPIYVWNTGSLAGFPNGLVKKGFTEPCSTSSDCQFNTRCEAPALGTCAHSVCEPGASLASDCSSCAKAICDVDPTCCEIQPEIDTCTHDPCARGSYLKTGCNSCVTDICAKLPACCDKSGSWTADCVAEVATTCGNTCECKTDELVHAGRCYYRPSASLNWSKARAGCTGRGVDWDLIRVNTAAENDFTKTNWGTSGSSWIGINDQSAEGSWVWPNDTSGDKWTSKAGAPFYTRWAATEPGGEDCAVVSHGTGGSSGSWYEESCTKISARGLCEGPPQKMASPAPPAVAWSAACVAKVGSKCGASCDVDNAASSSGQCVPWYPGETDPSCSGIDLAVAAPCDGVIPVCNHGLSTAPAGIRIVHFPGNSQQYPSCKPSLSHPQAKECVTKAPIPSGQCINVTDCAGLSGNREIMINPEGAAHVDECDCGDNWSLYHSSECIEPICAGGNSEAKLAKRPIDIIFVVDNSGSMAGEIVQIQNRIDTDFAAIMAASGIDYRVIMVSRYGDVDVAVGGSDHPICIKKPLGGNDCVDPVNETLVSNPPNFYHYSADIESLDSWCKLLGGYARPDELPTGARAWIPRAASGWSQWLRPNAFNVFVEISDDDVSCSTYGYSFNDGNTVAGGTAAANLFDAALRALSAEDFGTASARNYVWHSIIGMVANSPATTAWPATASISTTTCGAGADGPGTGHQALSKLTGGLRYPICNNTNFNAIFNAIAASVVEKSTAECDYEVPSGTSFDVDDTTVRYTTLSGTTDVSTKLTRATSAATCSATGWYYDDPSNPQTITLCPTTCNTVKGDDNARVWVEFGCPRPLVPVTATQVYTAACDEGMEPVWLDLGYKATLPGNATVSFRARTALSQAELATESYATLGTATAATATCPVTTSCALDAFTALGVERAKLPVLELEYTLTPSSAGAAATLNDWHLTYTCRDNE